MDIVAHATTVDYLVIGHITIDNTAQGPMVGGTAAYAALNARQHGLRVGIFTSYGNELPLDALQGIQIINIPTSTSSTFENVYTETGRVQKIWNVASELNIGDLPDAWKRAKIIHLAPVANEILPFDPAVIKADILGVTPQGWLRKWDDDRAIRSSHWNPDIEQILQASVAVLSSEDLEHDESSIEHFAHSCKILNVTEGVNGSRLYWNGDIRKFPARVVSETDPTGAGDIFASSFFIRLLATRDPWEAARYANQLAAFSVTRRGMQSIPTTEEIRLALVEVLS